MAVELPGIVPAKLALFLASDDSEYITGQGIVVERCRAGGAGLAGFYSPVGVNTAIEAGKEIRYFDGKRYVFGLVDRRHAPDVAEARAGEIATLTVTVGEHLVPRSPRQPYRVRCSDETGRLGLTFFNGREDYLKKLLPPGEVRVISFTMRYANFCWGVLNGILPIARLFRRRPSGFSITSALLKITRIARIFCADWV